MKIVNVEISKLKAYENNPRRIPEKAVDAVANSIKDFGFKVPCVIDKNNVIVTGHTRVQAAKKLGLKEVPCVIADDLTPEQIKAFRLADNKTSELTGWDFEKLDLELEDLSDFGMDRFDFDINMEEVDISSFVTKTESVPTPTPQPHTTVQTEQSEQTGQPIIINPVNENIEQTEEGNFVICPECGARIKI